LEFEIEYTNKDKEIIINETKTKYKIDLRKRVIDFAVNSIKFLVTLPNRREYSVFHYQFSKSVTSIGANYEESQAATTKEFVQKVRIALREANESIYWLKLMEELKLGDDKQRSKLIKESRELALILGAIVSQIDKSQKR